MVELNEGSVPDADAAGSATIPAVETQGDEATAPHVEASGPAPQVSPTDDGGARGVEAAAAGVRRAEELLNAATHARWPMYLRNLKQILRAAPGGFDERRYGFAGLVDLARACQKQGLVRLERDRRGGLRVFQGPMLRRAPVQHGEPLIEPPLQRPLEAQPNAPVQTSDGGEVEVVEEPMPIVDPTAELLGTTKRKRPARPGQAGTRVRRAPAVRKTAAAKASTPSRRSRSKKAAAPDTTDETGAPDDRGEAGGQADET